MPTTPHPSGFSTSTFSLPKKVGEKLSMSKAQISALHRCLSSLCRCLLELLPMFGQPNPMRKSSFVPTAGLFQFLLLSKSKIFNLKPINILLEFSYHSKILIFSIVLLDDCRKKNILIEHLGKSFPEVFFPHLLSRIRNISNILEFCQFSGHLDLLEHTRTERNNPQSFIKVIFPALKSSISSSQGFLESWSLFFISIPTIGKQESQINEETKSSTHKSLAIVSFEQK